MEKITYKGWANNLCLRNVRAELIITLDVGPRIIYYGLPHQKQNAFKELDDEMGKSGESIWKLRGGHRLWVAPEDALRTYVLDNVPVQYNILDQNTVQIKQAADSRYGIEKMLEISLSPTDSGVTVKHTLTNLSTQSTQLAIWALTTMAAGGKEIIPLPAKIPHPDMPVTDQAPVGYKSNHFNDPNQYISVWPFTNLADGRWYFGNNYITLQHNPKLGPTMLGFSHQMGWVGYLNAGLLFVKWLSYDQNANYIYPHCNLTTFSNEQWVEIEGMGPYVSLEPGDSTSFTEHWQLFSGVPDCQSEADIDCYVGSLTKQ